MGFPIRLDELRDPVLDMVAALAREDGPYGRFRQRPRDPPGFWGSVEAALILHTVNVINYIPPENKAEMVGVLNSYQRPDGSYDQALHDPYYAQAIGLLASRVLGGQPARPFAALHALTGAVDLDAWLARVNWHEPTKAFEQVYGALAPLVTSPSTPPPVIDQVFAWLDAHQSPLTGWWVDRARPDHKPDYLWSAFAVASLYALSYREMPRPELLARSLLRLQVKNGPMKGLFGSVDRPHGAEMAAAYLLRQLRPLLRGSLARDLERSAVRLCEAVERFLRWAGPEAHGLDTTAGLLARVQTLVVLAQMLPAYVSMQRPWKLLWQSSDLLGVEL